MNFEDRKNYNKTYYQSNRDKILKKACEKITCEFCQRKVISNNLLKHQKTDLCKNYEKLRCEREKRIKNNIEQLKTIEILNVENVENIEPSPNVKLLIQKYENKNI